MEFSEGYIYVYIMKDLKVIKSKVILTNTVQIFIEEEIKFV